MLAAVASERRRCVLVVEDEPHLCDMAAEALTEQGFEVEAVGTADEALRLLRTGPRIDALFTDVRLPGPMDGAVLARRARELRPDLAVMYTTGWRGAVETLDPVERSMFVSKPYDLFKIGPLLEYLVAARSNTTWPILQPV